MTDEFEEIVKNFFVEFEVVVKCVLCQNVFENDVVLCKNGHSVCYECRVQSKNTHPKCITCQLEYTQNRNHAVQRISLAFHEKSANSTIFEEFKKMLKLLKRELLCSTCKKDFAKKPIYLCQNGWTNICSICKPVVEADNFPCLGRNFILESVFDLRNKYQKEKDLYASNKKSCPLIRTNPDCDWSGSLLSMAQHVKKDHLKQMVSFDSEISWNKHSLRVEFLGVFDKQLFLLTFNNHENVRVCSYLVKHIASNLNSTYKYVLKLPSKDFEETVRNWYNTDHEDDCGELQVTHRELENCINGDIITNTIQIVKS